MKDSCEKENTVHIVLGNTAPKVQHNSMLQIKLQMKLVMNSRTYDQHQYNLTAQEEILHQIGYAQPKIGPASKKCRVLVAREICCKPRKCSRYYGPATKYVYYG